MIKKLICVSLVHYISFLIFSHYIITHAYKSRNEDAEHKLVQAEQTHSEALTVASELDFVGGGSMDIEVKNLAGTQIESVKILEAVKNRIKGSNFFCIYTISGLLSIQRKS